jgi:hypothetical protein
MTGIFLLSNLKPPILALAMTPLILYTLWWSWTMIRDFGGLSRFLALSSICEVERGEGADVVAGVRGEDGVSRSQRWVGFSRSVVWYLVGLVTSWLLHCRLAGIRGAEVRLFACMRVRKGARVDM